jgi:hypothetical protein
MLDQGSSSMQSGPAFTIAPRTAACVATADVPGPGAYDSESFGCEPSWPMG